MTNQKKDKDDKKGIYRISCDNTMMKKRADNRGVLWEPVIVKVNVGVPRKEIRVVDGDEEVEAVVDLEIDCSGLLLDGSEDFLKNRPRSDSKDKDTRDKPTDKTTSTNPPKEVKDSPGQYDFKVTIIDDQTLSINGTKKQMKNNNSNWEYLHVSHTFKINRTIMNSERNQKRTQRSFKRTPHGTILGFTLVNVKL